MNLSKLCRRNIGRLVHADGLEGIPRAEIYLVSFLGSRIDDPREFFEALQAKTGLSPCRFFGGKEKRADATSHYHVLIVFKDVPARTHGLEGFKMWHNFDFQDEVDTYDIEIRIK